MSLENLENSIIENNHLQEIKPANEMETEGMDLKEMNIKLYRLYIKVRTGCNAERLIIAFNTK